MQTHRSREPLAPGVITGASRDRKRIAPTPYTTVWRTAKETLHLGKNMGVIFDDFLRTALLQQGNYVVWLDTQVTQEDSRYHGQDYSGREERGRPIGKALARVLRKPESVCVRRGTGAAMLERLLQHRRRWMHGRHGDGAIYRPQHAELRKWLYKQNP